MASSPSPCSSSSILYEDKLCKKGKINKGWKNRWCVLKNNGGRIVLEYYDGKFAKLNRKLCGCIKISEEAYGVDVLFDGEVLSLIEQLPDNVVIKESVKSEKAYSFRIKTVHRKYVF